MPNDSVNIFPDWTVDFSTPSTPQSEYIPDWARDDKPVFGPDAKVQPLPQMPRRRSPR